MLKFQQKVMIMEKYFGILQRCPLFAGVAMMTCGGALRFGARVVSCVKRRRYFPRGNRYGLSVIVLSRHQFRSCGWT